MRLGKKYKMLALLLCLASASLWACKSKQTTARWRLARLDIEGLASAEEASLLRRLTQQHLLRSQAIAIMDQASGIQAALTHLLAAPPDMRFRLRVVPRGLQLSVQPVNSLGPDLEAWATLPDAMPVAQAVRAALDEALQALVAMHDVHTQGPQAVREALLTPAGVSQEGHEPLTAQGQFNLQAFAVRRVAQLKDGRAAHSLRQLLQRAQHDEATASDRALALQAVGSLVALCDRQAVLPIIALSRHQEVTQLVQLTHAIATLGGPMAEAYLVTMASGHLDEEVRSESALALSELARRSRLKRGCDGHDDEHGI